MATNPDSHPDSPPVGPDDAPDRFEPGAASDPDPDRENMGHSPMEDAGGDGGTAGAGGTTGPRDHDVPS